MLNDPCAALEPWLRSLAPRHELVTRLALRGCFHQIGGNPDYMRRIAELIRKLNLGGSDLNTLLEEARTVEARIDNLADLNEAAEKLTA